MVELINIFEKAKKSSHNSQQHLRGFRQSPNGRAPYTPQLFLVRKK